MERLEIKQKVENGKLTLNLPEEFNNKEVNVIISKSKNIFQDEKKWAELPAHQRIEILKTFVGADKFPYIKVGKHDVYHQ